MEYTKNGKPKWIERQHLDEKIYSKIWLYGVRGLFIAAIIVVCAACGLILGAFAGFTHDMPTISVASLGISSYSSVILDKDGKEIVQLSSAENREAISIEEIPQNMINALIAIEDERFYEHNGIDMEGVLRSGIANFTAGGTAQGGSTITQQVIKKLVLTDSQNWKRKINEWVLALKLEELMSQEYAGDRMAAKLKIVEVYLNYNFLGNNCYGIQTAAKFYFNKDAKDLTLAECALFAGTFQAPSAYNPITNVEAARGRQLLVLNKMRELNYITQDEYDAAVEDDIFARISSHYEETHEDTTSQIYSYFTDSVIREVVKDLQSTYGYSQSDAYNVLYYSGLTICSTQDSRIQKICDDYLSNYDKNVYIRSIQGKFFQLDYRLTVYDKKDRNVTYNYSTLGLYKTQAQAETAANAYRSKYISAGMKKGYDYVENCTITLEPQAAFVVTDYKNGYIVAEVGGIGPKTSNLSSNRVNMVQRQPGSAFKVIASYSLAVEEGDGTGTVVDDVPFYYYGWCPTNWDFMDEGYWGIMTYRWALIHSTNVCAARVNIRHGISANFEMARNYGFTTLRSSSEVDDPADSDEVGSLAIGSGSVYLQELAAAYGAIANKGIYIENTHYTEVYDHDDNLFLLKTQSSHRVIKATTAWLLTDMLRSGVAGSPDATEAMRLTKFNSAFDIAGKTGTTDNTADHTFVGYTTYYLGAIWTGYDYNSYVNHPNENHTLSYSHVIMWPGLMKQIHADLTPTRFARASGIVSARVCKDSGKLATSLCEHDPRGSRVSTEYYASGTQPTEYCDCHMETTICTESGLFPSEYCTDDCVQNTILIQRSREILDNIQEALDYCHSMIYEEGAHSDYWAALADFDYSLIRGWDMMNPICYDKLYVDLVTVEDGVHTPYQKYVRVWKITPGVTQVFDVTETHSCPICKLNDSLPNKGKPTGYLPSDPVDPEPESEPETEP